VGSVNWNSVFLDVVCFIVMRLSCVLIRLCIR